MYDFYDCQWEWYDKPFEVWDEIWTHYGVKREFVGMCYGEHEARYYEGRGFIVCDYWTWV
jgi:hypothetical protein